MGIAGIGDYVSVILDSELAAQRIIAALRVKQVLVVSRPDLLGRNPRRNKFCECVDDGRHTACAGEEAPIMGWVRKV
jgi:hypothetical protein